jgi:hypothetical protein
MANDKFFMNKQHGAQFGGENDLAVDHEDDNSDKNSKTKSSRKPDIHIKSHEKGHTVHVMHQDGRHDMTEHAKGDGKGISKIVAKHLGNAGQDHGGSSDEDGENGSMDFGLDEI